MGREGVWMIVSSIILVLITAIAALLIYLWFINYQSDSQAGAESVNLLPSAIITEATLTTGGQTMATATIEDVGDTNLYVVEAMLINQSNNSVLCSASIDGNGNGIAEPSKLSEMVHGNLVMISFSCDGFLPPGQYTVQIVTNSDLVLQTVADNELVG